MSYVDDCRLASPSAFRGIHLSSHERSMDIRISVIRPVVMAAGRPEVSVADSSSHRLSWTRYLIADYDSVFAGVTNHDQLDRIWPSGRR